MLKKVTIENFRSCQKVKISNLTGFTVMLGRNGAGKTNVLRAIEWAASSAVSDSVEPEGAWNKEINTSVKLEFQSGKHSYQYKISLNKDEQSSDDNTFLLCETIKIKNGRKWNIIVTRNSGDIEAFGTEKYRLAASPMTPCLKSIFSVMSDKQLLESLRPVYGFLRNVHYYPIDEPSDMNAGEIKSFLATKEEYSKWLSGFKNHPEAGGSVIMRLIHMKDEQQEKFDELKSLLGPNGLGLINDIYIDTIDLNKPPKGDVDESRIYYFVNFYPNLESNEINKALRYSNLSYGTRRVLRMLTSLLYDNSTLLLLEQPEDGIHSGLLNKLIPLLLSYIDPSQFIVTSHSSEIINQLKPGSIRLVAIKDAETIVRPLSENEVGVVERFICEEGSLSDFIESIENE